MLAVGALGVRLGFFVGFFKRCSSWVLWTECSVSSHQKISD